MTYQSTTTKIQLISPSETRNMERERAAPPVDVDVPGDAPAHHLQVVDPHALLQQVVPLLIVYQQYVLTNILYITINIPTSLQMLPARYLTQ